MISHGRNRPAGRRKLFGDREFLPSWCFPLDLDTVDYVSRVRNTLRFGSVDMLYLGLSPEAGVIPNPRFLSGVRDLLFAFERPRQERFNRAFRFLSAFKIWRLS